MKPVISIVVPVRNGEKTLRPCLDSLLAQDCAFSFEIIVVDNASDDKTRRIIWKYRRSIRTFVEKSIGSYMARNTGALNASGKILAFIDSDCIADKRWAELLIKPLLSGSVVAGGQIASAAHDSILQDYCCEFGLPQAAFARSSIPFFASANMAVDRQDFLTVGMFDGSLRSGGDLELCSRLVRKPKDISYVPEAIVRHQYPRKIKEFMLRQYNYGRWHNRLKESGLQSYVRLPSYYCLLRNTPAYLPYRLVQDMSFHAGRVLG